MSCTHVDPQAIILIRTVTPDGRSTSVVSVMCICLWCDFMRVCVCVMRREHPGLDGSQKRNPTSNPMRE